MTHLSFRRFSILSILFALVLSLTACIGNGGDSENKKTDQGTAIWEVPTGADPQY